MPDIILGRKPGGGGGSAGGVTSLAKSGDPALTGAVTLSEGSNITLTQVGQDIEIAAAGGGMEELFLGTLVADGASIDTGANGVAQTHTHLRIMALLRSTEGVEVSIQLRLRFNNDSGGTNYGTQFNYATFNTGGVAAESQGSGIVPRVSGGSASTGWFTNLDIAVPFYRGGQKKQITGTSSTLRGTYFSGKGESEQISGFWDNVAAITRVAVVTSGSDMLAGSTLAIYGY